MYKYVLEVAKQNLSPSAPPRNPEQVSFLFNTNFEKIFSRKPFFLQINKKLLIVNSRAVAGQPLGFFIFKS